MNSIVTQLLEKFDYNTIKYIAVAELGLILVDLEDDKWDWKPYVVLVVAQLIRVLGGEDGVGPKIKRVFTDGKNT